MQIPASITVGPLMYTVIWDPHVRSDSGLVAFGQHRASEQEIRLLPGLSPELTAETFFHELLHAIEAFYTVGLDEDAIRRISPVLYETLERNGILR